MRWFKIIIYYNILKIRWLQPSLMGKNTGMFCWVIKMFYSAIRTKTACVLWDRAHHGTNTQNWIFLTIYQDMFINVIWWDVFLSKEYVGEIWLLLYYRQTDAYQMYINIREQIRKYWSCFKWDGKKDRQLLFIRNGAERSQGQVCRTSRD